MLFSNEKTKKKFSQSFQYSISPYPVKRVNVNYFMTPFTIKEIKEKIFQPCKFHMWTTFIHNSFDITLGNEGS